MHKHVKILSTILALLSIIFIPLIIFLKFDNYKGCQIIKNNNEEYIILDKQTYNTLKDNKHLKLLQKKEIFKVSVEDSWTNYEDFYYAKLNTTKDFTNDDLKIYINSTNIFDF